jgi:2-polyprenyl-3-methyl-5-hydroxy-6-metoxy-1,4-benzoquinol methylase
MRFQNMENEIYYEKKEYAINRFRKNAILSLLGSGGKNILDIGCADGQLGEIIKKEKGLIVFGVEISEAACRKASARLDRVFCFDVQLPFEKWPDEIKGIRFDKVIISEVLEHLFYPENLLEKIKNLLMPGAEIVITVPNVLFWKNRLKIFFGLF